MFKLIKVNELSITTYNNLVLRPSSRNSFMLSVSDSKIIKELLDRFNSKDEKISVIIYEDENGQVPFASVVGNLSKDLEVQSSYKGTELRLEIEGKITINY